MSYKEYKGNIFKEDTLLSNEYIIDKLYELDYCNEEIEKLQRQKEELQVNGLRQETLFKLEIERLNNIINELEHYLKLEKWKSVGGIHLGVINGVLNKLQELKGSDKE